ncbi:MAG: HD domain-containing protein [Treponema sp.]|jgi:exopolyphosphatase/guanosine-5'-triphosphate,3'-diphosphate pyrophosphatase|nr:HD domain-containing protein [Treponema sp.]
MNKPQMPGLTAIIEIGSTGIRLMVAGIEAEGRWKVLDQAEKPVALGVDVFETGQVSRESLLECLQVIRGFRELLLGWGITGEAIRVIATSAIRAARNRDLFVDRVRQETGFLITIVDGIEENRLMYLAVRFTLRDDLPQFWRSNSMIIDIGGGSTEIMLLRRGKMAAAHSLRLGTILIGRHARRAGAAWASGLDWPRDTYLEERVRNTGEFLNAELELSGIKTLVLAGTDARYLAPRIGQALNDQCWTIDRDDFIQFVNKIRDYTPEDCIRQFQVPYGAAEGFLPGNMAYKFFLEKTAAAQVVVPFTSIREGLLIDLALGVDPELQEEFFSQTIASAVNLGRKYHFDEDHSRHVARLCMLLFDGLAREHGMNRRDRMMLETAAVLHDIGMFVRGSSHQRHGQYIAAHSEIFGLRPEEQAVIANVVGYHRGAAPSDADIDYIALQREERTLVLKMTSLLRVADALDRSHSQRIQKLHLERRSESVVLHTGEPLDLSTERISLEEKARMFQDVFGYKIVLG